jgi:hypothetical protein
MSEQLAAVMALEGADPAAAHALAWADAPARTAARRLLYEGRLGREATGESLFEHSVRARPLYAPTWLARGEWALRHGRRDRADAYATVAAALWPHRERLLWRVVMLRTQMADREGAFRALREYLRLTSSGIGPAIWIAERLEPDPARRAAWLLPNRDLSPREADAYMRRLLRVAGPIRSAAFTHRIWAGIHEPLRQDRTLVGLYVDALISSQAIEDAISAWRRHGAPGETGLPISNPGFEQPLAQGGLGWRIGDRRAASWERDRAVRHKGAFSLRISFEGTDDRLSQYASQILPVQPDRAYRLSGYWRGRQLTTSGAYVEVRSRDAGDRLHVSNRAKLGSWDWETFGLDFRVPSKTHLVEIRIRSDAPDGPVRALAGSLWLDDLTLETLGKDRLDG